MQKSKKLRYSVKEHLRSRFVLVLSNILQSPIMGREMRTIKETATSGVFDLKDRLFLKWILDG